MSANFQLLLGLALNLFLLALAMREDDSLELEARRLDRASSRPHV